MLYNNTTPKWPELPTLEPTFKSSVPCKGGTNEIEMKNLVPGYLLNYKVRYF